ncbi:hypothetical protein LCGC14_2555480, partial [marine sediment metagenome]
IQEAEHLSPREREIATLRVKTGVGVQTDRAAEKISPLAALYGQQRTGQPIDQNVQSARDQADRAETADVGKQALVAETQRKADNLRKVLPALDAGSQAQVRQIIDSGDPVLIDELYRSDELRKAIMEDKKSTPDYSNKPSIYNRYGI